MFELYIWALDELELSRTGMAAGATQHDMACQIELSTAEPLVLLPPKNPTRVQAPMKEPVVSADAPVGVSMEHEGTSLLAVQEESKSATKRARAGTYLIIFIASTCFIYLGLDCGLPISPASRCSGRAVSM